MRCTIKVERQHQLQLNKHSLRKLQQFRTPELKKHMIVPILPLWHLIIHSRNRAISESFSTSQIDGSVSEWLRDKHNPQSSAISDCES